MNIFTAAEQFRKAALRRERAAAGEMVRRYGEMWARIAAEIEEIAKLYREAAAAGRATSPAWAFQLERWQALTRQIEAEMKAYVEYAAPHITAQQWQAVEAARREAQMLIDAAMGPPPDPRLSLSFMQLPREAVQDLIGFTQDGSPLSALLSSLGSGAAETVKRELITGLGMGLGPREVAARCRSAFGGDLVRSLRVSRTETLRAYREAARRSFEANQDIVEGWMWVSGRDARTCAACLAMHGTIHPLSERLDDHPNGRCSAVPVTKGWAALGAKYGIDLSDIPDTRLQQPTGEELFARMSEQEQLALLGPAKLAAYQDGAISLADLVGQAHSEEWGTHRYERSLSAILGEERAEAYRRKAAA